MNYLFFARNSNPSQENRWPLEKSYSYRLWKPRLHSLVPEGIPLRPFAAWWFFHYARLFSNRDYALFTIAQGDRLVHRSCVFPPYFRFPFMENEDLQIGDTWTSPECRKEGLATFALGKIGELCAKPGRTFWYIVEKSQRPSIRVVEKAGFHKVGEGRRTQRFGFRLLGCFVIEERTPAPAV